MTARIYLIIAGICGILLVQGAVLYYMGRAPVCPCGEVAVWGSSIRSDENSQQLTDWYSLIHVLYGILGYFLARGAERKLKWKLAYGLIMLLVASAGWEIYENTPFFINSYNAQVGVALYHGDSIINSLADTVLVVAGFGLAFVLPTPIVAVGAAALEILTYVAVQDGVVMSTLMFLHPVASLLNTVRLP